MQGLTPIVVLTVGFLAVMFMFFLFLNHWRVETAINHRKKAK